MRTSRGKRLFNSKIKSLKSLKRIITHLQAKGKKVVFTNGCFDLLHYGHTKYLEDAKRKGDVLVVAVNSDASVKRIKGKSRPIIHQADRAKVIAALESVDFVTVFNQNTPFEVIKLLKPDILVKGADWNKNNIVGADIVKAQGGKVYAIKLAPGRSTTGIIKKIANDYGN